MSYKNDVTFKIQCTLQFILLYDGKICFWAIKQHLDLSHTTNILVCASIRGDKKVMSLPVSSVVLSWKLQIELNLDFENNSIKPLYKIARVYNLFGDQLEKC